MGNNWKQRKGQLFLVLVCSAALVPLPGFSAVPAAPLTFTTPQEAAQALIRASKKNDTKTLLAIFGSAGEDIVNSGDRKEDREARADFADQAQQKLDLVADPTNTDKITLSVGNDGWPFPVPLIRQQNRWQFDSETGAKEIVARRIGANELTAIEICHGYVEAQMEYAQSHQTNGIPTYADKLVSTANKEDGLYWEAKKGSAEPDVPKLFALAAAAMSDKPHPYHGYYFKVLRAQGPAAPGGALPYVMKDQMIGGFALVAWPADYGSSGVQTFIVDHSDMIYQKDLGSDTSKIAEAMSEFNPDSTWSPAQPEKPSK